MLNFLRPALGVFSFAAIAFAVYCVSGWVFSSYMVSYDPLFSVFDARLASQLNIKFDSSQIGLRLGLVAISYLVLIGSLVAVALYALGLLFRTSNDLRARCLAFAFVIAGVGLVLLIGAPQVIGVSVYNEVPMKALADFQTWLTSNSVDEETARARINRLIETDGFALRMHFATLFICVALVGWVSVEAAYALRCPQPPRTRHAIVDGAVANVRLSLLLASTATISLLSSTAVLSKLYEVSASASLREQVAMLNTTQLLQLATMFTSPMVTIAALSLAIFWIAAGRRAAREQKLLRSALLPLLVVIAAKLISIFLDAASAYLQLSRDMLPI